MTRRIAVVVAALLAAAPLAAQQARMSDAARQSIEREIRAIVDTILVAAREAKFGPIGAYAASEDGLCVWQARIYACSAVQKSYKDSWRSTATDRVVRQEMDSVQVRVQVITPDVAIAATTTQENRAYRADGRVTPARFASFFVYVRENGRWKSHSGQQASWPIVPAGSK